MKKKNDLPAMPFYVGDWAKAPDVRSCTLAEKGLWFEMICLMWESPERGVLLSGNGRVFLPEEIARIIGENPILVKQTIDSLEEKGLFSRRKEDNAIYCRRMVKDEKIRQIRRKVGKMGGNPNLVKQEVKQRSNQITETETANEDVVIKPLKAVNSTNTIADHVRFVDDFAGIYEQATGLTYIADKKDYVIAADLVKKVGVEKMTERTKVLAVYCSGKVPVWFCKEGWGDFTIGKLKRFWNNLVPKETEEDKARREVNEHEAKVAEMMKRRL